MKPFIKEFYVQCQGSLEDIRYPETFSCFSIRFELEIAVDDIKGTDTFIIDVCDKDGFKKDIDKYFKSEFEKDNYTVSRFVEKTLLVKKFNKEEIKNRLNEFVENCEGDTLESIYLKLEKYLEYIP